MSNPKHFVIELALAQSQRLSTADRIRLFRGVAEIMPDSEEGQIAANAAFFLSRAEDEQLKLKEFIS